MTENDLTPRPVRESQATMTELMMPNMANNLGNVFGGVILSLIDRVGAVSAIRHARGAVVTVSMDKVEFLEPIHLGELVVAKASVNFVGRTSMEIGVRVEAENIVTGVRRHTNSCHLTFVAIDQDGQPRVIPPVVPELENEKRRVESAKRRRERRFAEREQE